MNLSTSKSESKETARAEKRLPKTVQSFSKEKIIPKVHAGYSSIAKNVSDNSLFKEEFEIESAEKSIKRKGLLKNISEIEVTENLVNKNAVLLQQNDYWWEDDIEDWPWLEIALAIIAVLVIAIVVTILVSLIGGLVSSLFGLILLIALAYILYTLWF